MFGIWDDKHITDNIFVPYVCIKVCVFTLQRPHFLLWSLCPAEEASELSDSELLDLQTFSSYEPASFYLPPSAHNSLKRTHTALEWRSHTHTRDDVSAAVPSDRMLISAVSLASASSSSCVSTCSLRVPFLFLGASFWRSCSRWFVFRVCSLVDLRTDLRTEGEKITLNHVA